MFNVGKKINKRLLEFIDTRVIYFRRKNIQ